MSIVVDGRITGLGFKPAGKDDNDIVAVIKIECQPTELDAGRLSRYTGKNVTVEISSYQLDLPLGEKSSTEAVPQSA